MPRHARLFILFLITALLLAACGSFSSQKPIPTTPPLVVLKISGSGTVTTVLEALKPASLLQFNKRFIAIKKQKSMN